MEKFFIDYFFFVKLGLISAGLFFLALRFFNKLDDKLVLRLIRLIFFLVIIFVSLRVMFLFWQQFEIWQGSYFLPPYQPIGYFLQYSWMHFAKQPVFDISLGVFFFLLIWLGEKISRNRFFYDEEKYSGGLAILLVSWPQNILVFFLTLVLGMIYSLAKIVFIRGKNAVLVSFRYFWPVVGLALLLFGDILVNFLGLGNLAV